MKAIQDAYVVAATRSPIARAQRGAFAALRADDLLVQVLQGALRQIPQLESAAIDEVVCGCALPEASQGLNIARWVAVLAGLPHSVAGMTVNRFCASGLSAIQIAADRIRLGESEVVIAAGVESMSSVPMMGNHPALSAEIFAADAHLSMAHGMGLTAENVAKRWNISRQAQDAFAFQSHQRAAVAVQRGAFTNEITPIRVVQRSPVGLTLEKNGDWKNSTQTTAIVDQDEGIRWDVNLDGLSRLTSSFLHKGSVTAGNSSPMSDGAGVLVLASETAIKRYNLTPLAKWCGFASKGVAPDIMGIGPVEAIPVTLRRAGLSLQDMSHIELNEAFAAQCLAVMQTLELNPTCVNPLGGAIALGHPLGATGVVRSVTLLHALRANQQRHGMVSMCVGAGQGVAGIFESLF